MASNRMIRSVIITCLLSVTIVLGACSPPLPKTLLAPSAGTISSDRLPAMAAVPLTTSP